MNSNQSITVRPDGASSIERLLLAAFLENVPDLVYFKDRESRFIAASLSKAHRHGFDAPQELVGKTDAELFADKHATRSREDEERIVATGETIIGKLERLTWPDGHESWAHTSKMPLRNEAGQIIGTFGLSRDVTEAKDLEHALEKANKELIAASHATGMAEVATSVLHNVGNVLNSVNVSAALLATGLRDLKLDRLAQINALMQSHAGDLGAYLTSDPAGRRIPEFLAVLAEHVTQARAQLLQEIESLQKNVDHIKEIVSMQQAYATTVGATEPFDAAMVMEDAVRMNSGALLRHGVRVVRNFHPVPPIMAQKGKVLQILVNLIRNAKYACEETTHPDRVVTLDVEPGSAGRVLLRVRDNGVGIPVDNHARIFERGFTTREHGHGLGLHSSLLAAKDVQGRLTVASDGPGTGATFTLELPAAATTTADYPASGGGN